jgi:hypothetical protein
MVNDYQKASALKTPGHPPRKTKTVKDKKTFNRFDITCFIELFYYCQRRFENAIQFPV